MYFSKNSRYVLQRAQALKPFFKAADKNLSVKTPKDDPTKPPLRVNIPKEASQDEYANSGEVRESRSRSFTSGPRSRTPSITSAFEGDLLKKCDSFPGFAPDDILVNEDLNQSTIKNLETSGLPRINLGVANKEDYNEGLQTPLHEEVTAAVLANNYAEKEPLMRPEAKVTEVTEDDVDPKSLYIIIDVPERSEKKSEQVKERDEHGRSVDGNRPQLDRARAENVSRTSMSVSKVPFLKGRPERTRKFEINEVEEAATYVFHVKLNNIHRKPSQLSCVPEKEVTTRKEHYSDPSIKVTDAASKNSTNSRKKQVASIEEFPNIIRYPDSGKKIKHRKTESNVRMNSTPSPTSVQKEERKEVLGEHEDNSRKSAEKISDPHKTVTSLKHERKDLEAAKEVTKHYPFKDEAQEEVQAQHVAEDVAESPVPFSVASDQVESAVAEDNMAASSAETTSTHSSSEESNPKGLWAKEGTHSNKQGRQYVVPTRVKPATPGSKSDENVSRYVSIHDPKSAEDQPIRKVPVMKKPQEKTYVNISDLEDIKKEEKSTTEKGKDKPKTKVPKKQLSGVSQHNSGDKDNMNFQTSTENVSIRCEKLCGAASKFCAAFPPLLGEALRTRFKFRKDFYLSDKLEDSSTTPSKVNQLLGNSILFPKKETEKFDCESLFSTKDEVIYKIIRNSEEETSPESGEKPAAATASVAETENPGQNSVDSLTMMKKVKEIVQFDLDNVVRLYNNQDAKPVKEIPSVVMFNGDSWQVDLEELTKQEYASTKRIADMWKEQNHQKDDILGDNITEVYKEIKHLPTTKENQTEMKLLDSAMVYDPETGTFYINKDAMAEAISRKTNESISDVSQTLDALANSSKMEIKGGDSILVFDDETQSWKVDFSILERREEQLKIEEELAKRSELILETFEKLENGQMSNIPFPDSREKKTFDYKNEQWNSYNPDKKSKDRSKSPFKEPDAEEIRKQNSDLYEDLFVANKKDTRKSDGKTAPPSESFRPPKKSQSLLLAENKEASSSSSTTHNVTTPPTPSGPESPKSGEKPPPPEKDRAHHQPKPDEHFWESFINMNILPRDIRDTPKVTPPPLGEKNVPPPPGPTHTPTRVEEPAADIKPKVEEPKFKIRIPFIKDKKDAPSVSKKDEPPEKPTDPPAAVTPEKKDKQDIKAPPPKSTSVKKEEPGKKPTAGSEKKETTEIKTPPTETPAVKTEESVKKPTAGSEKKEKGDVKVPPARPRQEDNKKNPPASVTQSKGKTEVKAPPRQTPQSRQDGPEKKSSPTIGSSKSSTGVKTSEIKAPSGSPNVKIQEPKSSGRTDKAASATDHYVSDKIIEISRNKPTDGQAKIKANKVETVKLNITADKRLPSKVMEINLSKKAEEKAKETTITSNPSDTSVKKKEPTAAERRSFQKNFDKYKTPFSEPDFEEKSMKIKSDMESNPNLKKLDNWSKTLVLHDIMKPPENIESWLKDETDKMATLLLKVLQEAADGKPKKKQSVGKNRGDKQGKGNPYDNIRKKQENTPENFLFRVRTVNLSLENDKKGKNGGNVKLTIKSDQLKDIPLQSEKTAKPTKLVETGKVQPDTTQTSIMLDETKSKMPQTTVDPAVESAIVSKDTSQVAKIPLDITEEIPGPEILKKISNTWKVFPILGSQMTIFTLLRVFQLVNLGSSILGSSNPDKSRRHAFTKLFLKYGPIVNVQGPLSGNVILIHTPEHLTGVFEQDITTSVRSVFDSLEYSRRESEEGTLSVGVSTDWSKPEWNELKKETIDPLMKGSMKYFGLCDAAGESLVSSVRKNRNAQNFVSEDFMDDIRRWSLEGLCSVIFEKSFGFLEGRNTTWMMEPDKLYLAIEDGTKCLSKCERGFQMWRLMTTPSAMGLSRAYRSISSILAKQLYQAEINLKGKAELLKSGDPLPLRDLTFIESMLLNDGMTTEEITCNLVDIILIGTNAMSSALGFILYNLAQNVKVQMKLLKELKDVLPNKDSQLNYNKLMSLKYLQACLKETLRLHFPVPVFYRLLQNDILLANYIVPKGTFVVMDYRVSSMKEQVFDDPDKFIPERWTLNEQWMNSSHPFGAFPLCHGPRGELAKRVVEMQLMACVAKIIRNFQVDYQYGEIQGTDGIISVPDKPLKLNFVEREI